MKLSFIIPTYNEETTIESTIKRLKSDPPDCEYEIIVSDAESKDKTATLAKPLADKVIVEPKKNIARGRNAGAAVATGEYFVFLDSGVRITNTAIFFKRLLDIFENNSRLVGATVAIGVDKEPGNLAARIIFKIADIYFFFANNIFKYGSATGKFQMVRASAFREIGGYNENIVAGEDLDLFLRLAKIGKTHSELGLSVYHAERRIKKLGWRRLLWTWMVNSLSVLFRGRSVIKEWKDIR